MFFPYRDSPNTKGIPWITWGLMALLFGVFALVAIPLSRQIVLPNDPRLPDYITVMPPELLPVALLNAYDLLVFEYGFRPVDPNPLAWGTSLFLHAGWPHLLANLVGLWLFGDNVEKRMGWWKYLLAFFGTALVSTAVYAHYTHQPASPLIGASGGVYGVIGLYFLWFPKNQVKTLMLVMPVIIQNIQIPARHVLAFFLIVNNLLPFLLGGKPGPQVAYSCHLGGFLAGALLALILERRDQTSRPTISTCPQSEQVARLLRLGFSRRAVSRFRAMPLTQQRQIPGACLLELGAALGRNGAYAEALYVYRHLLSTRQDLILLHRARAGAAWIHSRVKHLQTEAAAP